MSTLDTRQVVCNGLRQAVANKYTELRKQAKEHAEGDEEKSYVLCLAYLWRGLMPLADL